MPAAYCDVAVPVPLPDHFTYTIPAAVRGKVWVGCRVLVPFGARKLVGVVTAMRAEAPLKIALKELVELLDDEPVLPRVLLSLAGWISDYYVAPPGEVFRAMLPLHSEIGRFERVQLRPLGREKLAELARLTGRNGQEEAAYSVLKLLENGKPRSVAGLLRKTNGVHPTLRRLRREGAIEILQEVRRRRPRGDRPPFIPGGGIWKGEEPRVLTGEQSAALAEIERLLAGRESARVLLHGVTGSGKTEVYARAIHACLEQGRRALLLVPEIALTPAVTEHFAARFGDRVAVLHSGLTPRERSTEWWRLRRGEARVAVGTRSAVFAPLENLGLVIVDEEQDASLKQGESPRYHGRDTAIVRARLEGAVVVLGSATPALETSYHARSGRYRLLSMGSRVADRKLASVRVVDMRAEFADTKKTDLFSRELAASIEQALTAGGQVLVLRNRRGYANFVLCRTCGTSALCAHCSISLTFHRRRNRLICHYCGYARTVPEVCEKCGSEHLYFVGEGTEKLEEALRGRFAHARVARLDRDTTGVRGEAERILRQFSARELDILVGTQMIAKGHDFHGVTLVGVLSADALLGLPDFRAAERTFQLLTQVAGRAGRGLLPGQVLIQTHYPDHYAIRCAAAQDYDEFYEQEMRFRRLMGYPPFVALANVVVRARQLSAAVRATRFLQEFFAAHSAPTQRVLGPAPAPIARLKKEHRFQFLLKSPDRSRLQRLLGDMVRFSQQKEMAAANVLVDVDPLTLL